MCEGGKFVFVIPRQWVPLGAAEDIAAWSLPVIVKDSLIAALTYILCISTKMVLLYFPQTRTL